MGVFTIVLRDRPQRFLSFRRGSEEVQVDAIPACRYSIFEDADGVLRWNYVCRVAPTPDDAVEHNHVGYLCGTPVLPEDAELLTGLLYPAAMDRLRELV